MEKVIRKFNINKSITQRVLTFLLIFVFTTSSVAAAMRSDSYVIYENVNHSFDGPVISDVSAVVSGQSVTINWSTNLVASSFVVYDTSSSFLTSKEQGNSIKNNTTHSVEIKGLEENTIYYYKVKSERVNGGITTDNTIRNFTSGSDGLVLLSDNKSTSEGNSVLIIDKTDKRAPEITNVAVNNNSLSKITITWDTNEDATSFIEYGTTKDYGSIRGQWLMGTEHEVRLEELQPKTTYYFRAVSSDDWGNIGYGENKLFNTSDGEVQEEDGNIGADSEANATDIDQDVLENAAQKTLGFLKRLLPEINLNDTVELDDITTIEDLSNFIPAPILSGDPRVNVDGDKVEISWSTDIEATSQVALSPIGQYKPEEDESYIQVVGDAENLTKDHSVLLHNLEEGTMYHYQLRSKAELGPMAVSRDFTFTTLSNRIEIISFFAQVKDNNTAVVKWATNKQSDSQVQFTPYHGNIVAYDEAKIIKNNQQQIIHEIEIKDFQPGVFYDIEITSKDSEGNKAMKKIDHFSTEENDLPPEILYIKANSTVFLDKSNKTQTVISWTTNEPTMGQVYYQEGVHASSADLSEQAKANENFTKNHIFVITKFKPGAVYSFRVAVVDSSGNTTKSKTHTFMTAKKKESIIQVIIKILEDTFGWVKDLM